jgi:hypothetical protein
VRTTTKVTPPGPQQSSSAKIGGGQQELEESIYWMELLTEAGIVPTDHLADLQSEANELMAIFASSIITAKNKR